MTSTTTARVALAGSVLALLELALATYLIVASVTYEPGPNGDEALVGVGIVFGVILAMPSGVALLLSAAGYVGRHRGGGQVLAALGLSIGAALGLVLLAGGLGLA